MVCSIKIRLLFDFKVDSFKDDIRKVGNKNIKETTTSFGPTIHFNNSSSNEYRSMNLNAFNPNLCKN